MKTLFIIFTTYEFCGIPLGLKLQREGHQVLFSLIEPEMEEKSWHQPKNKYEQEVYDYKLSSLEKTGLGMVKREWAKKVVSRLLSNKKDFIQDTYIIFDYIAGYKYGQELRDAGFKVLGGSKLGYNLETDRDATLKLLNSMGLDMPKKVQFGSGSADKGIEYLRNNQDELYAFKSDNTDVGTTVAENSNEELIDKIEAEKQEINKASFILQEKVEGLEGNIETWYSEGKPIMANVDLEVKKKYNELSSVQTGCAYDLVFTVPLESEMRKLANKPIDKFMAKHIPTGRMDLAFIYSPARKKMYALEVCGDRFGYNQIYTLLSTLLIPVGEFLMGVLNGDYVYSIKSAAIIINGKIYEGKNHFEAIQNAAKAGEYVDNIDQERDGVFVTTKGKVLTREEAIQQFGIDHSSDIPQLNLFEGFGASLRVFNDDKAGDNLIEYPQGFEDNVWLWGAYMKEGRKFSMSVDSVAILTTKGENPESAFAKVKDIYESFFISSKYCRDDFTDPNTATLPISRYHKFKKLKMI